ncbi:MAG: hypothetical protein ACR2QF_03165 [Geminicoccaceae bacterium]
MDEKPELTTHVLHEADPSVQLRMISQVVGVPLDDFHRDILSEVADKFERLNAEVERLKARNEELEPVGHFL